MNKIFQYTTGVLASVALLSSCDPVAYDGEYNSDGFYTGKDNVYFHYTSSNRSDSVRSYSFGTASVDVTKDTVWVQVNLAGKTSSQARSFALRVDEASSAKAGVHYTALATNYTIPAGEVSVKVPIEILRENLGVNEADTTTFLSLRLEASEQLGIAFPDYNYLKVKVNNVLVKPSWWDLTAMYYGLGPYSRIKYLKFLEYYENDPDALVAGFSNDYNAWIMNFKKVYDYFKAHPEYEQTFDEAILQAVLPYR